jgi:site-specific recombinase XerD
MDTTKFQLWMVESAKPKRLSPNTASQYARRIRQMYEEGTDPRRLSDREAERFVIDRGGSESNTDHWIGALRRYQDYLRDVGEEVQFAERLRMTRRPKRLPHPVSYGDLYRMLESIPSDTPTGRRDRAVCELLYCSLRNEELCNSNLRDFRDREVRVIGKMNKERLVPLNDVAWGWLRLYALEQHGGLQYDQLEHLEEEHLEAAFEELWASSRNTTPMFLTSQGNRLHPNRVREITAAAARSASLTENINPHRLRHSFATHVLDGGASDLMALKDVMGHETWDMIQHYVAVSRRGRFDRVNSFHPRQRGMTPAEG